MNSKINWQEVHNALIFLFDNDMYTALLYDEYGIEIIKLLAEAQCIAHYHMIEQESAK